MNRTRKNRSGRFSWLTCSFIVLVVGLCCILEGIPFSSSIITDYGDAHALALEQTRTWLNSGIPVIPSTIIVTPELVEYAASLGVSEDYLKVYIAAAYSQNIRPWHILGFAQIESSFCTNIGGGVAIDEVNVRLAAAPDAEKPWWEANVTALYQLASELGVNIRDIPGSIGAGAISCLQLMPVNWMKYGGGDFNDLYTAINHAGGYLNDTGYKDSFEKGVRAYNPGGGDAYVNSVVQAANAWEGHFAGSAGDQELGYTEKPSHNILVVTAMYLEFLRANMYGDTTVPGPLPVTGDFTHPFPTFTGYGYLFWSPVYVLGVKVADHTGIDYIGPEGDLILAAHNGQVVYAEYLSRFTALAVKWWISGNVIVIRGSLEDDTPVCSFYGHGQNGSVRVNPGQDVTTGQQIMSNGSTGFSTAPHLHFAIKIGGNGDFCDGGSWVNPADYIK